MGSSNLVAYSLELIFLVQINLVVHVIAYYRTVCRKDYNIKVVDFSELTRLGVGCTCHARKLSVHAEVVLECYCGMSPVLAGNLDFLLGLDSLMQTVGIAAPCKDTAGELIYYLHLASLHHIVHIPVKQLMGLECLGKVMDIFKVVVGEKRTFYILILEQKSLYLVHAVVGEHNMLGLFLKLVVTHKVRVFLGILAGVWIFLAFVKIVDKLVHLIELAGVVLGSTRYDKRRPGLVDKD